MFANRYTAVIDACSLVRVLNRNLLLTLAEHGFFRVRWSDEIINETQRALQKIFEKRGDAAAAGRALRSVEGMKSAFPEATVGQIENYQAAAPRLPDPKDEHVLLAALATQAQTIVTENLRHFPASALDPLNIEARSSDDFIADTIMLDEGRAVAAIRKMRMALNRPEIGAAELLNRMEASELIQTATVLLPFEDSL
jgi:hypothetical protein